MILGRFALLWLVAVAIPLPVRAQISPGELAHPHRTLEGNRNCTKCHGDKAGEMNDRCLACHGEIRALRDQRRGFHFRVRGTRLRVDRLGIGVAGIVRPR
jgi:hypothetical protein